MMSMDARSVAFALGGEVVGRDQVLAPGPGHSAKDRSLSVQLNPNAPDGILVFSHAGDDALVCKNYVRRKLGMPEWRPGNNRTMPRQRGTTWNNRETLEKKPMTDDELRMRDFAVQIWNEAQHSSRYASGKIFARGAQA
jgi:hypothetical protein